MSFDKHADPVHEVALIGAGPIGLEMAAALKRAGVDYVHLERGRIGETISRFPRQMRFYSSNERIGLAGLPLGTVDQAKASREEYLAYLRQFVLHFGLEIRSYEAVTRITRENGGFELRSEVPGGSRRTRARRVILAIGGTHRPRRLGVPGEHLPHVDHAFVEPHRYFARRLLIVGGRNSAAEAALRCYHAGVQVALSYRRQEFQRGMIKYWLQPELEGRLERGEIEDLRGTVPVSIGTSSVRLRRLDGSEFETPADFVLPLIGFSADHELFEQVGMERIGEEEAPLLDMATMESSVPGVYVIGTAIAGEQHRFGVFLENCHVHVERVLAAITGGEAPPSPEPSAEPES